MGTRALNAQALSQLLSQVQGSNGGGGQQGMGNMGQGQGMGMQQQMPLNGMNGMGQGGMNQGDPKSTFHLPDQDRVN